MCSWIIRLLFTAPPPTTTTSQSCSLWVKACGSLEVSKVNVCLRTSRRKTWRMEFGEPGEAEQKGPLMETEYCWVWHWVGYLLWTGPCKPLSLLGLGCWVPAGRAQKQGSWVPILSFMSYVAGKSFHIWGLDFLSIKWGKRSTWSIGLLWGTDENAFLKSALQNAKGSRQVGLCHHLFLHVPLPLRILGWSMRAGKPFITKSHNPL